jgi:hypothetical protein
MESKRKMNVSQNVSIVLTEFSSGEWAIEIRFPMSFPQMLTITIVSKSQHRQHWSQYWDGAQSLELQVLSYFSHVPHIFALSFSCGIQFSYNCLF